MRKRESRAECRMKFHVVRRRESGQDHDREKKRAMDEGRMQLRVEQSRKLVVEKDSR